MEEEDSCPSCSCFFCCPFCCWTRQNISWINRVSSSRPQTHSEGNDNKPLDATVMLDVCSGRLKDSSPVIELVAEPLPLQSAAELLRLSSSIECLASSPPSIVRRCRGRCVIVFDRVPRTTTVRDDANVVGLCPLFFCHRCVEKVLMLPIRKSYRTCCESICSYLFV